MSNRALPSDVMSIIIRVEDQYPKASLLYAHMIAVLYDAEDRRLSVSDLSERLGKGRDSTTVQNACARMEALGIVTADIIHPGGGAGGPTRYVTLQV